MVDKKSLRYFLQQSNKILKAKYFKIQNFALFLYYKVI